MQMSEQLSLQHVEINQSLTATAAADRLCFDVLTSIGLVIIVFKSILCLLS